MKTPDYYSIDGRNFLFGYFKPLFWTLLILLTLPIYGLTDKYQGSKTDKITLIRESSGTNGGYGYRLQYYVPATIDAFWQFKTDFDSDLLLTSDDIVGHRLVETVSNSVITENRYATAPGLKFLWQTTVIPEGFRLEFKLLNAEDCRHDFHYGSIQLSPAGDFTKVTQIANFNFRGASFWVNYPWYGGMKSTLTKMVKWEQKMASSYVNNYLASNRN